MKNNYDIEKYPFLENIKGKIENNERVYFVCKSFCDYINYLSNISKINKLELDQHTNSKEDIINYEDFYDSLKKSSFDIDLSGLELKKEIKLVPKEIKSLVKKYPILLCIKDELYSDKKIYEVFKSFDSHICSIEDRLKE